MGGRGSWLYFHSCNDKQLSFPDGFKEHSPVYSMLFEDGLLTLDTASHFILTAPFL